jgi:hypothetical protein
MKIPLDLKKHCIETEIRLQFENAMASYFRGDEARRRELEARLVLLESALKSLDFSRLRSRHPALAGGGHAKVYLELGQSGPVVVLDEKDLT